VGGVGAHPRPADWSLQRALPALSRAAWGWKCVTWYDPAATGAGVPAAAAVDGPAAVVEARADGVAAFGGGERLRR
jgi:hypothetical protein